MEIRIRDYRALREGSLLFDAVALIAGQNGVGKSSTLEPIKAALTGLPIQVGTEYETLKKGQAAELVNRRAGDGATAYCQVLTGDRSVTMSWPDCRRNANGLPELHMTPAAAGLDGAIPPLQAPRQRAAWLQKYLNTLPTHQEWADRCAELLIQDVVRDKVWTVIGNSSWDGAHEQAVKQGKELKAQWAHATGGEVWGSQKGETWVPEGWRSELASANDEDLARAVQDAGEHVDTVVKRAGISQQLREDTERRAGELDEKRKTHQDAIDTEKVIQEEINQLLDQLAALPDPKQKPTPCPHCKKPVMVSRSTAGDLQLSKPSKAVTDDEIKAIRLERASIDTKLGNARHRLHNICVAQEKARMELVSSERAAEELPTLPPVGDQAPVLEARERLAKAEADLAMFRAWSRAAGLHKRIVLNAVICEELAPHGLRKGVLAKKMDAFHAELAKLCEDAALPPLMLDKELELFLDDVELGPIPATGWCASELFRVCAVFQVWSAMKDGSALVTLDNRTDLDQDKMKALIRMCARSKVPAVIATIANSPKDPNLVWVSEAPPSLVRLYWVDGKSGAGDSRLRIVSFAEREAA